MPELPEVETVKNSIFTNIQHKIIESVTVNHHDVIKNTTDNDFASYLIGEEVLAMERRGKYLIFRLSHHKTMVVHLRMTGQLVYFPDKCPNLTHCHAILNFTHGGLYYRDVRRFGGFWIGEDERTLNCGIEKLGVEPLSDDCTGEYLWLQMRKKQMIVKGILLDQSIIAGIGNIYADEICFLAKVHPLTCGCSLTEEQVQTIVKATKEVLSTAISLRGTTFNDYRDGIGEKGGFQDYLKVFQRGGSPCIECGSILQKTRCAGRGTTYCPNCQPYPEKKIVIGLTGGIACGKTMVSNYLEDLGAEIVDADVIAHEVLSPKSPTVKKIAQTFGEEYLDKDGGLMRKKMREEIFRNKEKVKALNAITHPVIRRVVAMRIRKSKAKIVILVAPLLIESKFYNLCDEVWLLYSEKNQQMKRLLKRDQITKEVAENMISAQMSYEKKRKFADVVIDNSGKEKETKAQIKEIYQKKIQEIL